MEPDLTPQGTAQVPEEPQTPPQVSETPVQTPPAPPVDPANDPNSVDYWKNKATQQAKENIVLNAKVKEAEARRELTTEPTDSDLRAAFPEWDMMDDVLKRSATMAFKADRVAQSIAAEREAEKAERSWQNDLEMAVTAHPELGEKAREFKDYASKPSHRGVPIEILIKAFKQDSPIMDTPTPQTPSAPALEPGNGGPRTPEKPKVLSGDELKQLRETNEKAYREYIQTHDIEADI